jgi:hypothetical protein
MGSTNTVDPERDRAQPNVLESISGQLICEKKRITGFDESRSRYCHHFFPSS